MSEELNKERVSKSLEKRRALKELEETLVQLELFQKAEWSIMQDLALDVEAYYSASSSRCSNAELAEAMKKEAKLRYSEYEGLPEKIIAAIPSTQAISKWRTTKKWQQAIWDKCKETGLFTKERKATVIQKVYERIMEKGDMQAAKMWLTMAGEYADKTEVKSDKAQDIFREINETLHRNKG